MKNDFPKNEWTAAEGEREQLRRWSRLPFQSKLRALEEMGQMGQLFLQERQKRALPYFDPVDGKLIR